MEGPRERLERLGPCALSDSELLAVLLGTGRPGMDVTTLAAELLQNFGGLSALLDTSAFELREKPGIGTAKAARILAALELGTRAQCEGPDLGAPLIHSVQVYERFGKRWIHSRVERFFVIAVDSKNRARAVREIARGGRAQCQVDPAEVFRTLLREAASGAIFLHNHPSGDPEPSPEDIALTERLRIAADFLGIRVLDHLVIGRGCYVSFRDLGALQDPRPFDGNARSARHRRTT